MIAPTEDVGLLVIARLDGPHGAAADLYSGELLNGEHGHTDVCWRGLWWESLPVSAEGQAVDIADVDATLTAHGYTRTCDWRPRTTASGATRYFAEATIRIENI